MEWPNGWVQDEDGQSRMVAMDGLDFPQLSRSARSFGLLRARL